MLTTLDLLAAAKSAQGIPSNYRLARVLGVSDQTVFNWSKGHKVPDDATGLRLADMAGLDRGAVLAALHAARASDAAIADAWASAARRLLNTAAALALAILSAAGIAPSSAEAQSLARASAAMDSAGRHLTEMHIGAMWAALGRILRRLRHPPRGRRAVSSPPLNRRVSAPMAGACFT